MNEPTSPKIVSFAEGLAFTQLVQDPARWQCTACGYQPGFALQALRCPECKSDQYGHRSAGLHALQLRIGSEIAGHDHPVLSPLQLARLPWHYRLKADQPPELDTWRANAAANRAYRVEGNRDAWGETMGRPWCAVICCGGESSERAADFPIQQWKELRVLRVTLDQHAGRWPTDVAFATQAAEAPQRIRWHQWGRLLVATPNVAPALVRQSPNVRWMLSETLDPHTQALREEWGDDIADEVQTGGGSSLMSAIDWCARRGAVVIVVHGAEGETELGAGLAGAMAAWCMASGILVHDRSDSEAFAAGMAQGLTAIDGAAKQGLRLPQIKWTPKLARSGRAAPRGGGGGRIVSRPRSGD